MLLPINSGDKSHENFCSIRFRMPVHPVYDVATEVLRVSVFHPTVNRHLASRGQYFRLGTQARQDRFNCSRDRRGVIVNIVSITSDRPDYHSVFVRNGEDVVELVGTKPWRTLFRAVLDLKVRQLRRRFHAAATKREETHQVPTSNILPIGEFVLSRGGNLRWIPSQSASNIQRSKSNRQIVRIDGKTVDQLSGARPSKKNQRRPSPGRIESDRPTAS